MNTIELLENRLQRECPAFRWHCASAPTVAQPAHEDKIQIRATRCGAEVAGSPFFVSPDLVSHWGVDSTARIISSQLKGRLDPADNLDFEWDKLGEF